MSNKVRNHNASHQLSQFLAASVKMITFAWFQSEVSQQTKHVHLRKLEMAVTVH